MKNQNNHEKPLSATSANTKYSIFAWWPLLLGPLSMASVYIIWATNHPELYAKGSLERLALPILSVPLLCFAFNAVRRKSVCHWIMTALCVAFFCREWHFYGTSKGVYVALVLIGIWAYYQRQAFLAWLGDRQIKIWLIATFAAYVFSQIIARRVFKHILPYEQNLHVPLEELAETTAHLMMLITSLVAFRRSPKLSQQPISASKKPSVVHSPTLEPQDA